MIGAKIKQYLENNGIKQSFLADKIGVTRQRMTYICSSKDIDCITYYKICKALNLPFETFLEGEA